MSKNKNKGKITLTILCLICVYCVLPLSCQPTEPNTPQNTIINYSLVPTLFLQNTVLTISGSTESTVPITPVACEIMILRPSARD